MGEVSNCLSKNWQMRSDVPPPPIPLSFSRMKRKHHTSVASLCAAGVGEPHREPEGPRHGGTVNGASRRARPLLATFAESTNVAPFGMR